MAGDWIKVEVTTASKAEVLRIASMLGVSRRECMGVLVDYWGWLDANASTESVPNLSRQCLDDVLHCDGFAACLEAVGWAKWAADGWGMTVINYDDHNGSSAKTRAYEQKKKRGQRRDKSGTNPGQEKRREEKNKDIPQPKLVTVPEQPKPIRRKPRTSMPADFSISERVRTWAKAKGYDRLEEHFARFVSYCKRAGAVYADWDEALMGAIRENWAKLPAAIPAGQPRQVAL